MRVWLALPLFLTACAADTTVADSWRGKPLDDLVHAWGPPAADQGLADGRRTVVYRYNGVLGLTNTLIPLHCEAVFSADREGTITAQNVNGNRGGCKNLFASKPTS